MSKTHLISFTSLFGRIAAGHVPVSLLNRPDVHLSFGCSKEHLLGSDPSVTDLVPMEVTWSNETLPTCYSGDDCVEEANGMCSRVRESQVDPDVLEVWHKFRVALIEADEQHRVHWQCGNYHELKEQLVARGDRGFYLSKDSTESLIAHLGL